MSRNFEYYYINTAGWDSDDFAVLERVFSRMVSSYNVDSRGEKIKEIDLSLMSLEIKTLLYCVIISHNSEELLNLHNLSDLKSLTPLGNTLIVNDTPLKLKGERFKKYNIYEEMNIQY